MSQNDFFSALDEPEAPSHTHVEGRRQRRRRAEERRKRRRRRTLRTLIIVLVLAVLVGGIGYEAWNIISDSRPTAQVTDYSGAGSGEVVITIPEGASGSEIAKILYTKGVVASEAAFTKAFSENSNASKIQAGTYTLRKKMSAVNAVAMLLDPANKSDHSLTIPPGFTKAQVKDRLMAVGGFTSDEVEQAFATAAASLPAAANGNVEGWLAPSTYDIPENAKVQDVVNSMVSATKSSLESAGVSENDYETVLIKASIVEREVASTEYYGKVARVIENRLANVGGETNGYLQMDSTVLYGLGRSGGIPTTAQISDASNPYNTYQHAGLPPSPIDSPSAAAIKAVMAPEQGNWLYFVTVNLDTGETLFASTHAEQQANTEKLKAYCSEHADTCSGSK